MKMEDWYNDPDWALPMLIIVYLWKNVGYVALIYLAALQAVPKDLVEAATLDGVGWFSRLRYVTLPLLSPQIFFVVIISLINGSQVFDQVYAMTGGGPNGSSAVVVERVYDLTFRYGQAGMASALSMLLFAVIMIITMIQIRGERKWVNYA